MSYLGSFAGACLPKVSEGELRTAVEEVSHTLPSIISADTFQDIYDQAARTRSKIGAFIKYLKKSA